jgi:toxin ParE1/3/4
MMSFLSVFPKLQKNPYMFQDDSHFRMDYRSCVCGVDTIFYKINNDVIEIMAIIGRQDF